MQTGKQTQDQKELNWQKQRTLSNVFNGSQQNVFQGFSCFDELLIQANISWRVRAHRVQPASRFMAVTHLHSSSAGKLSLAHGCSLNGKPQKRQQTLSAGFVHTGNTDLSSDMSLCSYLWERGDDMPAAPTD